MGTINTALSQLMIVYHELVTVDALGELDSNGISAFKLDMQQNKFECSHAYFSRWYCETMKV